MVQEFSGIFQFKSKKKTIKNERVMKQKIEIIFERMYLWFESISRIFFNFFFKKMSKILRKTRSEPKIQLLEKENPLSRRKRPRDGSGFFVGFFFLY